MKKNIIFIIIIVFSIYYLFNLYVDYNINSVQVPVLVYHDITNNVSENRDSLSVDEFERQINYLISNGYNIISSNDLYEWKNNNKSISNKSVVLTFDDGYYSFKYLVKPILEKYNISATCFIIGSNTRDITPEYDENVYGTIGLDEINNYYDNIIYASHTYALHNYDENNNKLIDIYSYEELDNDIKKFNNDVFKTDIVSYPYFTYTKDYIKALKNNNYKMGFAGENEMCIKNTNNFEIPRISAVVSFDEFKNIFETDNYRNRYGSGIIRKILVFIKRKLIIYSNKKL